MEGTRTPEKLKMTGKVPYDTGHEKGPAPDVINFEGLKDSALEEGKEDVIGLGEGETTPFSAQQGEHP